jgi:hypothetical protein
MGGMADRVRIIEYEIVAWSKAGGILGDHAIENLPRVSEIGVFRCVRSDGAKVTLAGDAGSTRALIDSGDASNPEGLRLPHAHFPIMRTGWPGRFPDTA